MKTNTSHRKESKKAPKGVAFTTPAGTVICFPDAQDKPTYIVGKEGKTRLHGSVKRTVLALIKELVAEKCKIKAGQIKLGLN